MELLRAVNRHVKDKFAGRSRRSEPIVQAAVLSGDPLISYSGTSGTPLGLASHMPSILRDRKAWFLVSPTWSIETEESARAIRKNAVLHRMRNRHHCLIFLCNTQAELDLLHRYGEAAFLHNKTSVASERLFKPLGAEQAGLTPFTTRNSLHGKGMS
ncbi:MAG: hypothetical protein KF810_08290 [Rhizobiaceae bacterium]|nr:hypothetical protein [Rhizobiaceae bacterium]